MVGGKHVVGSSRGGATYVKTVMHGHPHHSRPGFPAPPLVTDGADLPAAYRREAQRLLSLVGLGAERTRYSLIELARLYDALATHVEARDRPEAHDRAF